MILEINDVDYRVIRAIVAFCGEIGGITIDTHMVIQGAQCNAGEKCRVVTTRSGAPASLDIRRDTDDWSIIVEGSKSEIARWAQILTGATGKRNHHVKVDDTWISLIQATFVDAE